MLCRVCLLFSFHQLYNTYEANVILLLSQWTSYFGLIVCHWPQWDGTVRDWWVPAHMRTLVGSNFDRGYLVDFRLSEWPNQPVCTGFAYQ